MVKRSDHRPSLLRQRAAQLTADPTRVISRLFLPRDSDRIKVVLDRVLGLSEDRAAALLSRVLRDFGSRHRNIEKVFENHYRQAAVQTNNGHVKSIDRQRLIGAYFTAEFSLESVALFNPSIVPHPDQTGLKRGAVRFIMSLRACGEGHISSIAFRTGVIDAAGRIRLAAPPRFAASERPVEDRLYERHTFALKLAEMGTHCKITQAILGGIGDDFTLSDLRRAIASGRHCHRSAELYQEVADKVLWLAQSNYHLEFPADGDICEQVIFPVSEQESRGIEDARFVRFVDDDGRATYYATTTAYNGFAVLPQLIETEDFRRFKVITLNGRCVQNKGMALFPRKIRGAYHMISRLDGGNLFLMASDNLHFWNQAAEMRWETQPWEFFQVGNCGSPVETEQGWLLLTHGVGPMRQYCIGAALLDLDDPTRVVAHLREPLIAPAATDRDGYVPNVVYTCGAMLHNDELIIPYAVSDTYTVIASVSMSELLSRLTGRRSN